MFQVVFAGCAIVLLVGAATWVSAARATLRRSDRSRDTDDPDAQRRVVGLAARDVLVATMMTLIAIAALAEAVDGRTSTADWFLAAAIFPTAALLPLVRRFQTATERDEARERRRLELLYEVAAAGENLSLQVTAQRLAETLTPALGDWGVVVLLDRRGQVDVLAVARSGDEERDLLVEQILLQYPVEIEQDIGVGAAIRSGESIVFTDITDELLSDVAQDPEHLALLRRLDMGAAVIEPLSARGGRFGAIAVINRAGRPIDDDSMRLLADVAGQAAPVLDNALLHRDLLATEHALRFSEAVLRAQGESGVEGLLVVSPEGEMLSHNSRFTEMWGLDGEILEGRSDEEALEAAMRQVVDPDAFLRHVRAMYADPVGPARDEVHFTDGRVFDRYGAPLRLDDGSYVGWAWYFRDITDERQTQQSLLESGERFAGLARTLQESLLPPDLPDIVGAEVAARYHPAGDGSEVGGDFYDVFQVNDAEWCAVMGDVCGKGAPAARLTALARYTLRSAATRSANVERNLQATNAALYRQAEIDRPRGENRFATATIIRFRSDGDGITVVAGSGGHPPPLVVRADGTVDTIDCRGTLLGVFEQARFRSASCRLAAGDAVVLYTDGVTEARRADEEFGDARLRQQLRELAGKDAAQIAGAIEQAVHDFQGEIARDDVAVLVVRAVEQAAPGDRPRSIR